MAIKFTAGAYIQRASSATLDSDGTLGVWYQRSGRPGGTGPVIMGRCSSLGSGEGFNLILSTGADANQDKVGIQCKSLNGTQRNLVYAPPQTSFDGAWHLVSLNIRQTNAQAVDIFYDGGNKTSSNNTATWDYSNQPVRYARSADTFWGDFDGSLSCAFWYNEILTDMEHYLLGAGCSPLLIRPQALVLFIPMVDETQSLDLGKNALALTTSGTLSRAAYSSPFDSLHINQFFDTERTPIIR